MFDIREELKTLPELPGVYLMKNASGKIIYIGKARVLKNRVKQYFTGTHDPKTSALVDRIKSFEYIVTDNEVEALILESTLIKKHMPYYNILLKDDKSFPYLRVDTEAYFPTVTIVRRPAEDGAKYFGPFHISATNLNRTLNILKKAFPIRSCNKQLDGKDILRPCLNYHIKKCAGACAGYISREEYLAYVKHIIDFFSGKHEDIVKSLEKEMLEASDDLDFEKAADLRDKIGLIKSVTERQKIVSVGGEDEDYIAIYSEYDLCCIAVFYVRDGKVSDKREFIQKNILGEPIETVLDSFMKQYYTSETLVPKTIVVNVEPPDSELIQKWLSEMTGRSVTIKVPQRGKKKEMIDMVLQNAQIHLKNTCLRQSNARMIAEEGLHGLKELLDLEDIPVRIEAYDVSNFGSSHIVAGRIVYINGKKEPSQYRRYKIRGTDSQDDYLSMSEVLRRRFKGGKDSEDMPDLILIDGGKGHVAAVSKVLRECGLSHLKIAGMVKDDKHKTAGLITPEGPVDMSGHMPVLRFLSGIQEETHRYAIAYSRLLTEKAMRESALDDIPGIGPTRKKALLKAFQSVDKIKKASTEELKKVKGITEQVAENIYHYFNEDE
ncbi:MAG: excinuclease ABC subunit UvrC [Clostridia bacterium]|jgi:excinuclease ABC subunit C|nr:excinuclease ABC subunit UvrC [Clostridiaceae bacterium]